MIKCKPLRSELNHSLASDPGEKLKTSITEMLFPSLPYISTNINEALK